MFLENRESQRFCEYIGRHVRSRYPIGTKSAVSYVIANKMVADVNVFRARSNRRIVRESAGTLIVGEERKRSRNRKGKERKKKADPKSLLESMSQRIIFSFCHQGKPKLLICENKFK
jgi:hypothetical protein